ncbi:MAG TPA: hypothetical protein PLC89_04000 [Haliscomenobacter sp.]|uniref:TolB family protein n=1 Tax=Haliscomenobacter sp. TaxID=2717303 RepID=UPI002C46952B|nr:hypothetical protein [Haliscomenobacter sp.]HOY16427.1 hypothetical protein [Haliscomenobacter sp.]
MKWMIIVLLGCSNGLMAQPSVDHNLQNTSWLITSVRTNDTEVFAVNPATGDAWNVSRSPASEDRYPAWSPDGKKVVFTSNRADVKTYDLYLANADGSKTIRLSSLPLGSIAYWPSWTADGTFIYFNEGNSSAVYRVRPSGKDLQRMADGRDACISPNGAQLVYTQRGQKGFGVWVMSNTGQQARQIIPNESEIGGIAPVWSSDGKQIAFSMQVGDFAEIFICNADGNGLKQVTNLQQISSSPAFSPDGKYLSFRVTNEAYWRDTQKRDKTYQEKAADKRPAWIIGTDGSNPQLIEPLHYQCAMDGSRAEWKPLKNKK